MFALFFLSESTTFSFLLGERNPWWDHPTSLLLLLLHPHWEEEEKKWAINKMGEELWWWWFFCVCACVCGQLSWTFNQTAGGPINARLDNFCRDERLRVLRTHLLQFPPTQFPLLLLFLPAVAFLSKNQILWFKFGTNFLLPKWPREVLFSHSFFSESNTSI